MRSIQSVVINLGRGDINRGFFYITAQIIDTDNSLSAQFTGTLPKASKIGDFYQVWQATYRAFSQRLVMLSSPEEEDDDDELEIETTGITQVSQLSFEAICSDLANEFNNWLQYSKFLQLERKLRSHLSTTAAIRIIIETDDELVKRLPWHCWNFLQDYPDSEIALSRPEYKQLPSQAVNRKKVRILAILGNSQDIDIAAEQTALKALPDAETKFLIKPSRREFDRELWDTQGWDILFFAGHSRTEGETGRIYINEEPYYNSLTIEQLEEALKTAISRGLKLAIFNSCDGLGLANALEKLHIPQVIVMREPVPNLVAQQFFHYFLLAFAVEKLPLYLAVKQARCRLRGLESEYPAASWLPVICQNPAVRSPNWLDLGGIPPCPYRGLFAFQERDADLFFGREQFVADLRVKTEQNPFVAIVGASGSGKSSVVFAGLVPQLRRAKNADWQIVT
ncbi:CHAT domain-containing protein, partial [Hyella patelloides]|uniref:nSTAND1 domain-containing NTPase n=1 Tax=Hyella patelloides TaxID=1982969 RepID=UPI001FE8FD5C